MSGKIFQISTENGDVWEIGITPKMIEKIQSDLSVQSADQVTEEQIKSYVVSVLSRALEREDV